MPHATSVPPAQRLLFASLLGLMWAGCGDDFVPDQQPPPDPCATIRCDALPAPSCEGQVAISYNSAGTCQAGACAYPQTLTNCASSGQVCSNGVCLDTSDPCAGVSCTAPPVPSCQGQVAVTHNSAGTCQGGVCSYQEILTSCAANGQICSGGLCVDMSDPCAGISCNAPPAPSCDGQVAVTHDVAGACEAGMCSYQETRTDCAANNQICSNGACMAVNDPCANVSCNTPPAPSCDGQVAVTHNAAGACQAGMCSYQETRTSCTANRQLCNMGACITSNSALDLGAGAGHTCARIQNNTVRCWGSNISGQLGEGTLTFATRLTPVQVSGLTNVVEIAVGGYHSCARLRNNTVMCWGDNNHGQLGDGTTTDRPAPVQVSGLTNAVGIAAGIDHTCARRLDNTVVCWGLNSEGQLGNGANTRQTTPVQVSGLTQVIGITAGDYHSCARRQDNTVRCWGDNLNGQLGDGTTTDRNMPVQVSNLNDVLYIAAGGGHTCAYTINDTFCWGKNVYGQLGDGTTTDRLTPTLISGLNDASEFALGAEHTCALRTNGTMDCWGWNGNGRLGDGTTTDRLTPTPVLGL